VANIFSRDANKWPLKVTIGFFLIIGLAVGGIWYYWTPKYTRVGYEPIQPVPFDHALHAEQLGMDCRYCHGNVEKSAVATVPSTETCISCHQQIKKDSPKLTPLFESWESGDPVEWVRVHKLPGYVYFNHSVHVGRGVSCVSCHGQVNEMTRIYHAKPLSMSWCLDCHRTPENHLRPLDKVFELNWKPEEGKTQLEMGEQLKKEWNVNPPVNCAGCHR